MTRAEEDCRSGHPLARTTEAGWLALDAHETKVWELVPGEPMFLRTCARCKTTLSKPVEKERAA